jgi:hypothetical protein
MQWQQKYRYGKQDYPLGSPVPQDLFISTSETSVMSEYYTETKAAVKSVADKRPPNIHESRMVVINDIID